MKKDISLPNSNLYLKGFGYDTNGNRIVKLTFPNATGFSIQTNGNLPQTHRLTSAKIEKLTAAQLQAIEKEVVAYIKSFGSPMKKKKLRTYNR